MCKISLIGLESFTFLIDSKVFSNFRHPMLQKDMY